MEGICIRNWGKTIEYGESKFLLKKKSEEFKENSGTSRKPAKKMPEKINELVEIASTYVNKNRTLSLFSKEGELQNMKDFGKYMSLYSNDLFEDFNKENEYILDNLQKNDVKLIKRIISSEFIREELLNHVKRA